MLQKPDTRAEDKHRVQGSCKKSTLEYCHSFVLAPFWLNWNRCDASGDLKRGALGVFVVARGVSAI